MSPGLVFSYGWMGISINGMRRDCAACNNTVALAFQLEWVFIHGHHQWPFVAEAQVFYSSLHDPK